MARAASRERRWRMPEPDDGKLSRPVPRGREAGNGLLLPDSAFKQFPHLVYLQASVCRTVCQSSAR